MKKKRFLSLVRKKPPEKDSKIKNRLKKKIDKSITRDIQNVKNNKKAIRLDQKRSGKEKSFFNYQVVKYRLNTILKDSDNIERLNNIVNTFNHMSQSAYHLTNLYVLNLLERKEKIPIFNQTFFNRICNSISSQNRTIREPELSKVGQTFLDSLKAYKESLPDNYSYPDRKGMGTIQNFLTASMVVATKNHLTLNFDGRFQKYLKVIEGITNPYERSYIFKTVFNLRGDFKSKLDQDQRCQDIVKKYRTKFGHPKDDSILKDSNFTLPLYLEMLKVFEETEEKTFSLMPLQGTLIPGHIIISSSCLIDILSLWSKQPKRVYDVMNEQERWSQIFSIPKNNKKWFGGIISTNGYDASVYYLKPPKRFKYSNQEWNELSDSKKIEILDFLLEKRKESKKKKKSEIIHQLSDYDRFLSNDPGHRSIFTMIDTDGHIISCSSKEFKHLTGQKERLNVINRRKDSIPILLELNQNSLKTSKAETFLKSLKARMLLFEKVIQEYKKMFYRKMNFSGKIRKQKTFHELGRRIEERYSRTLIGWGAGGTNQKGLKGNHMPNKEFKNYLKKNTSLVLKDTDEYKTTARCCLCGSENSKVRYWKEFNRDGKEEKKLIECYGLRRCKNNECRITWDRDVNACQNIMMILLSDLRGVERPEHLRRPIKKEIKKPS